ncbi:hypothetical protein [Nannocystis sp.]|uniref:hypothetical protein n=1 Tax=Nannocystis sp. TaxID=1962667 RepID=UPI00242238A0|nr:hypothetical protein [Nannocystis sp.]MBK7829062.1 hypothetical protein [Nannocystis sp.]MBK9757544.1 hypothetical protein [Nannocystis sp.]
MLSLAPLDTLVLFALLQPVAEGPSEAPTDVERPVRSERAPTAAAEKQATWASERRRLQLHTGLSGGFASAMVLTGTLLLVVPGNCSNDDCFSFGRVITGVVLLPLAAIPIGTSIYWGVRLGRHHRQQPTVVLRPRAGGLVVHF